MGAGIIRVEKVKAPQLGGLQMHVDREGVNHSNPDIDPRRSNENRALVQRGDYEDFVWRRIAEGRESKRKVRKDAVVLVDGIVTAPNEDMGRLGPEGRDAFFRDALEFVRREFGDENIAFFTVHADETTAHAHFGAVPLKDGSLSWKKFFPSKWALSAFQDRFFEQVSSRYGLDRGEVRKTGEPARRHKSVQAMKKQTEKELSQLNAEVEKASERLESVRRAERAAQEERAGLEQKRDELRGLRAESLRNAKMHEEKAGLYGSTVQRIEELDREARSRIAELEGAIVAERERIAGQARESAVLERAAERAGAERDAGYAGQLRAVAAAVSSFDGAKRAEKGLILARIADGCDSLRGIVEKRISGLRERINGLRERVSRLREGPTRAAASRAAARRVAVPDAGPAPAPARSIADDARRAAPDVTHRPHGRGRGGRGR